MDKAIVDLHRANKELQTRNQRLEHELQTSSPAIFNKLKSDLELTRTENSKLAKKLMKQFEIERQF